MEEALVGRLGALRTRYRQHHDQLGPARAEVRYCQHLVDRCRVRLLSGQTPLHTGLLQYYTRVLQY